MSLGDMDKQYLRLLFGTKQTNQDAQHVIKNILHRNKNTNQPKEPMIISNKFQNVGRKLLNKDINYLAVAVLTPGGSLLNDYLRVADPNSKKAVASWNFRNKRTSNLLERLHRNENKRKELLEIISPSNPRGLEWVVVEGNRKNLLLVHPEKYKEKFPNRKKISNSSPRSKLSPARNVPTRSIPASRPRAKTGLGRSKIGIAERRVTNKPL